MVRLEEEHTARICVASPAHAQEADREARAEAAREVPNDMWVCHREGATWGIACNREGWDVCREVFERWCAECEVIWAREDVLGLID